MIQTIDHINIVVHDLERNVAFYRDILGFRVTLEATLEGEWIDQVTGLRNVLADCVYLQPEEGPRIELLRFRRPDGPPPPRAPLPDVPGIRHVAFRVTGIDDWYRRLSEQGVEFNTPPMDVPVVTVTHLQGRKRLCYFRGPEGVLLELAEFTAL